MMLALLALSMAALANASPARMASAAIAYSDPGACIGNCWTHDPSMIQRQFDGMYFRFSTGNGVNTMMSPLLEGPWVDVGAALPEGSKIHLDGVNSMDIWAPDLHYDDGVYYMYYVVSKLGTQTSEIGVATSETMEPGDWIDHGAIGLPVNSAYNRIDPNWINIQGKQYVQFGSYWQDLYQVQLDSPLKVSSATPHQLAYNASLNHREEAPFMFEHENFYYLLFSGGIAGGYTATYPAAGEEYRIHMCRSTSGTEDFVDKTGTSCLMSGGTILLESHDQVYAPGGQGVLNDESLNHVLYYHYYPLSAKEAGADGSTGYKYGWNELGWKDGWPYVKDS